MWRSAVGLALIGLLAASPLLRANEPVEQIGEPSVGPAAESATIPPLKMMRQAIGENLPDTILTDDSGREVRFFTDLVKDHAVVISFFYTNCRGTCPGTNIVLSDVRERLAADFGKSVRFIAISVEPEKDDVAAISEYAAQYRAEATDPDMPEWVFLTGKPEELKALRYKLGYYSIDPVIDADPTQHEFPDRIALAIAFTHGFRIWKQSLHQPAPWPLSLPELMEAKLQILKQR